MTLGILLYSTSSWSSSLTPLGLVKSNGPSHSGWVWPWDKVAPMSWEDEDEEDEGSEGCIPSLLVFFMLRSKVPFSSTSMSVSYRVQIYSQCNWNHTDNEKTKKPIYMSFKTNGSKWKPVYLGAGLPGLGAESLWPLPAAGGQVEDGRCCHVGCFCILAIVITTGGWGALRKASWHTVTGGGGLRERFTCVGVDQREFSGKRRREECYICSLTLYEYCIRAKCG